MSTNWRELPAGKALDILIADKLGWRIVSQPFGKYVGDQFFEFEYTLAKPDGSLLWNHTSDQGWRYRIDDVWNNVTGWWTPRLPAYSTSIDAAMTLVDGLNYCLNGDAPDQHECWLLIDQRDVGTGKAPTPALAICRAYLDMREFLAKDSRS